MGRGKSRQSVELIRAAREILEAIQPASVRAVCDQLFDQKLIASMAKSETNRVSTQLRDARERAMIPWSWIVDETREAWRRSSRPIGVTVGRTNPIESSSGARRAQSAARWRPSCTTTG